MIYAARNSYVAALDKRAHVKASRGKGKESKLHEVFRNKDLTGVNLLHCLNISSVIIVGTRLKVRQYYGFNTGAGRYLSHFLR